MVSRFALTVSCVALFACDGQIGDTTNLDASRADRPDIPADVGIPPECEEAGPAIVVFETKCVTCHRAGGTFPVLTRDGLADLKVTSSGEQHHSTASEFPVLMVGGENLGLTGGRTLSLSRPRRL